ncbi:hypothetical protein [Bacillus sp. S/N-304-OC-R1]|uniref:hypothetical protein n=1 Tax=Bacillus sp. S/N-304-OC-R1 TaxID=2758034 RepID=UPI001C8D6D2E|nr:hypothetical protein [Bacillus sp. S/N-304-OC-R1]MBY0124490.1 hypothetical protein [Bacillus sp. S/N-304-OC-R1]
MNMFLKPKCLTQFLKYPQYEIYCLDEEYESKGVLTHEKTTFEEGDDEIYEKITGESMLVEDDDLVYYKEGIPKFVRINENNIEKMLKSEEIYSYDPLEESPNLYTEIAKIEYFDIPSLTKFIENFGLPFGLDLFPTDIYSVFHYELDLFGFYNTLYEYKKTLNVFEALQTNNKTKINEYAEEFKKYVESEMNKGISGSVDTLMDFKIIKKLEHEEGLKNYSDFSKRYYEIFREEAFQIKQIPNVVKRWYEIEDAPPEFKARHYLVELMNNWDKGNSTYAIIDGQIHPGTTFNDLIEVAYYQLSCAVIGNIELRRCENCNSLFEVIHESRRFCPPLPGVKISTCQNTYNQRIKRKRKKDRAIAEELYSDGYTLKQIADKLNRNIDEISGWLNI